MLKLGKNQVKAKKRTKTELLLFENYLHSSSKIVRDILKNIQKLSASVLMRLYD